jgi:hypothetical protein
VGAGNESRFGLLLRTWRLAGSHAGFELTRSFGKFFGNFPKKLGGATFGFGGNFFFHVFSQTGQFFVETATEFFEFVHKLQRRYIRRVSGIIGTQESGCKEECWPFPIIGRCAWSA